MIFKVFVILAIAIIAFSGFRYIKKYNQQVISCVDSCEEQEVPRYLYILVSTEVWEKSLQRDELALSPYHNQFIHLAKEDQVTHVSQKFWRGSDYVILKIDTDKLIGRLVYETNPGGSNKYYHLYEGTIPMYSVVESTLVKLKGED